MTVSIIVGCTACAALDGEMVEYSYNDPTGLDTSCDEVLERMYHAHCDRYVNYGEEN